MSVVDQEMLREMYPAGTEFNVTQVVNRLWPDVKDWEWTTRRSAVHTTMRNAIKYGLATKRIEAHKGPGHKTVWYTFTK